jgi:hypothetical protein
MFKFLFRVIILLSLILPNISFVQAGFGVTPPNIKEDRLVPGSTLRNIIYLVQGDPNRDIGIRVSVESADIENWISFPNTGMEFIIPMGVQQFPLLIQTSVPEDAELGVYKAFVRVSTIPNKVQGDGQVAIALGGRIDIDLTVGDDVFLEYKINSIKILDIKEGESPRISVKLQNTGNVPASPQGASFELFNKFGNIRLAYAESSEFSKVLPFEESDSFLSFPIDIRLAQGEYWGHVKIYDDEGHVIKELKTVFNVTEKKFSEGLIFPILIGVGIAIVIFAIVIVILRIRNKRKRAKLNV